METLHTVSEVARLTRLSGTHIYRLVETGALMSLVLGSRTVRIPESALRDFIRTRGKRGKKKSKRKVPVRKNRPKKPSVHLTDGQREMVRKLHKRGWSYQKIADRYGCSKGTCVIACGALKTQKAAAKAAKRRQRK